MQFILEKISERQSELANLPESVKIWMTFMRVLFFSGVVFVIWKTTARLIVITMILTGSLILTSKIFMPGFDTIASGTIIQLVLWSLLLYLLMPRIKSEVMPAYKSGQWYNLVFAVWASIAIIVISISTALNLFGVVKLFS